jgi:hypothetical protein
MKPLKTIITVFIMLTMLTMISACDKSSGGDDNTRDCEKHHTAKVKFKNNSTSNSTYNVVWDGSVITTLYPFDESDYYTVAAGTHTLTFKISNTGQAACNPSSPVIAECQNRIFSCSQ